MALYPNDGKSTLHEIMDYIRTIEAKAADRDMLKQRLEAIHDKATQGVDYSTDCVGRTPLEQYEFRMAEIGALSDVVPRTRGYR